MKNMYLLAVLLLHLGCNESRDPIEKQSDSEANPVDSVEETTSIADVDKLLEELEMSQEELDEANEKAEELMENDLQNTVIKTYSLDFKHSGMCLDIAGNSTENNGNLQQYDCHLEPNQKFQLFSIANNQCYLRNVNSRKCLTLASVGTDDGINIVQLDCINADIQKFEMIDLGDGYVQIRSSFSQKCFDNTSSSFFSPNNVVQWECHGGDNQRLRLTEEVQALR